MYNTINFQKNSFKNALPYFLHYLRGSKKNFVFVLFISRICDLPTYPGNGNALYLRVFRNFGDEATIFTSLPITWPYLLFSKKHWFSAERWDIYTKLDEFPIFIIPNSEVFYVPITNNRMLFFVRKLIEK